MGRSHGTETRGHALLPEHLFLKHHSRFPPVALTSTRASPGAHSLLRGMCPGGPSRTVGTGKLAEQPWRGGAFSCLSFRVRRARLLVEPCQDGQVGRFPGCMSALSARKICTWQRLGHLFLSDAPECRVPPAV